MPSTPRQVFIPRNPRAYLLSPCDIPETDVLILRMLLKEPIVKKSNYLRKRPWVIDCILALQPIKALLDQKFHIDVERFGAYEIGPSEKVGLILVEDDVIADPNAESICIGPEG